MYTPKACPVVFMWIVGGQTWGYAAVVAPLRLVNVLLLNYYFQLTENVTLKQFEMWNLPRNHFRYLKKH